MNLTTIISFLKKYKWVLLITAVFGTFYGLLSFGNHYLFRTYAWDLGIRVNSMWDYMHFNWNDCMLMTPHYENILSDHFHLLPILFSPLGWIFGSWTPLVVQWASILLGGIGIYKIVIHQSQKPFWAHAALIHFFSMWGIFSALGFDYHDNVVGAMLLPWFIYHVIKERWWYAFIFLLLILFSKENMSLWLAFVCFGLILLYKERAKRRKLMLFGFLSVIYFILVVKFIMPSMANAGREYLHFNFHAFGKDMSDVMVGILEHPIKAFTLLFESPYHNQITFGLKSELHFVILLSGGIVLLYKPQYLIMLAPIYIQKLFNDDFARWEIGAQYSIEFAPVLTLAVFHFLRDRIKWKKWQTKLGVLAFTISCISISISVLEDRVSTYTDMDYLRFYRKEHYTPPFDRNNILEGLSKIPDNAAVSAQMTLVPRLAMRDHIYLFPEVRDAEYIALIPGSSKVYPCNSKSEYFMFYRFYRQSPDWEILYENRDIIILKCKKENWYKEKLQINKNKILSNPNWKAAIDKNAVDADLPFSSILENNLTWVYNTEIRESVYAILLDNNSDFTKYMRRISTRYNVPYEEFRKNTLERVNSKYK